MDKNNNGNNEDYICEIIEEEEEEEEYIDEEEEEEEEYIYKKLIKIKNKFIQNLAQIKLKNYEPVKTLAKGSFINTIKIKDKKTDQFYSAKRLPKMDKNFKNEVKILSQLSHPSITKFIGYSLVDFDNKPNPMIIAEYYGNDNLYNILTKSINYKNWDDTKKMITVYGIASAMSYLHSKNILQRNLKPESILMDQFLHPKISDFCLAKKMKGEKIIEDNLYGTSMYVAPEIFKELKYTKAGDVYSFSMVLYDIFVSPSHFYNMNFYQIHYKVTIENYRPPIDIEIPSAIKVLIESCWAEDDDKRPTFEYIVTQLKTDKRFIFDGVDKEAYYSYINMIDHQLKKDEELKDKKTKPSEEKLSKFDDDFRCISCEKQIKKKNNYLIISGFKYHKRCVKCSVCHKKLKEIDYLNGNVCITPGLFICKEDYEKYQTTKELPKEVLNEYRDKMVKNSIKQIFRPFIFNDEKMIKKNSNKILVDEDMKTNSYHLNKHYKYFVPTSTFHFETPLSKIKIIEFIKLLPKETIITNIEQGSTIITIAFLLENEIEQIEQNEVFERIKESCLSINNSIIAQIQTPLGQSIVGTLIEEPIPDIPIKRDTKQFFMKDYVNVLQNFDILEDVDYIFAQKEVREILKQQMNANWGFIFDHFNLFGDAEKIIRESLLNNGIEMMVIGETIIANKYYNEYERIKEQIIQNSEQKEEDVVENILYHGTSLGNHRRIIEQHFLMPGEDNVVSRDSGYFGVGIYVTDNIFYSSIYSNNYKLLGINDAISVICCQCICSGDHIVRITNHHFEGLQIPDEIKNKFGVHQAFVGSENNFHVFAQDQNEDQNLVVAYETVFPNKFQIVPICSLTVLRTGFFVLWADENGQFSELLNKVKNQVAENVYYADNYNDVEKVLKTKKRNPIKAIISSPNRKWIQEVIQKVHDIFGENIICLVLYNINQIGEFEHDVNVIYTCDILDVIRFSQLNIFSQKLVEFIEDLENKYDEEFNLNEPGFYNIRKLNNFKCSLK